jgi:hypothetical protein
MSYSMCLRIITVQEPFTLFTQLSQLKLKNNNNNKKKIYLFISRHNQTDHEHTDQILTAPFDFSVRHIYRKPYERMLYIKDVLT